MMMMRTRTNRTLPHTSDHFYHLNCIHCAYPPSPIFRSTPQKAFFGPLTRDLIHKNISKLLYMCVCTGAFGFILHKIASVHIYSKFVFEICILRYARVSASQFLFMLLLYVFINFEFIYTYLFEPITMRESRWQK